MSRHLGRFTLFLAVLCLLGVPAVAAPFEVTNIQVSMQAKDAVKARDLAITKAQRIAFATLVGKGEQQIASVTDDQIARLVRGFSLRGERLSARSYAATFSVRFNPAAAQNFIHSGGFTLVDQALQGELVAAAPVAVAAAPAEAAVTDPAAAPGASVLTAPATSDATAAPVPATPMVVVLPVLDIGSRRILWDEPNPWREIWQKDNQSVPALQIRVPLGDVDDVTEIPDGNLINGGAADVTNMLTRYTASNLFIIVAKNMGGTLNSNGGIALSLYRHDGQKLSFVRKSVVHPRPGHLFEDAVAPSVRMIVAAQNNTAASDVENTAEPSEAAQATPVPETSSGSISGPITVTMPYQSLAQWVGIQRRLRLVPGVKAVIPVRVSSSSAQVKIMSSIAGMEDLKRNFALQGFNLQTLPNGEIALTEQ